MKRVISKWTAAMFMATLISSCNIKAPIEEILPEGNRNVAPYIAMKAESDTFCLKDYLPQIGVFDSISAKNIRVKTIRRTSDLFVISTNSNHTNVFGELQIWKNGLKSSLIVLANRSVPKLKLETKSFLNGVIFISGISSPKELLVVWQNTILPERFVSTDNNGISVFIPKEAKELSQSSLRVFATSSLNEAGILTIHLTNGEPHLNH